MQINNLKKKRDRWMPGNCLVLNRVYQLSVPVIMEKDGVVDSYFNGDSAQSIQKLARMPGQCHQYLPETK